MQVLRFPCYTVTVVGLVNGPVTDVRGNPPCEDHWRSSNYEDEKPPD
ncbi:hypothetical protein AVEN_89700-1, partial [Araneus ventricosus]